MLSIKTLCSLLLLVFLLGPNQAYAGIDITPTVIKDSQPGKPLNSSSSNYKPINITFDHSNVDLSDIKTSKRSQYLNETILPSIQSYFRAALKVLPRSSNIIVKPDICKDIINIPGYASETGYDSDLVIFVKIIDSSREESLVQGAACGLDERTGRPTVGVLIFNKITVSSTMIETKVQAENFMKIEVERRIDFTMVELIHILGFRDKLLPYYINPDTLQPLTGHFFNKTVNDVNTVVLNVTPLTQRVRDYFNCPTAEGVYLENQGDSLTMNSHFERRVFGNELMTAGEMYDRRISQFTLALLEGTGWYKVNYDLAEPLTYGKGQGCAFLDTKCFDPVTLKPNFKEFCSPLTELGVSWTKRGSGPCAIIGGRSLTKNPDLIAAFDYWGNKTVVADKYSDNCPTIYVHYERVGIMGTNLQFDCENVDYLPAVRLKKYETRSIGSKAFMGTLSDYNYGKPDSRNSYCFEPKCMSKSDGKYEIQIPFGSAGVVTCSAAGSVSASSFEFSHNMVGVLECPDPKEFCERILAEEYCKGGCYGNGVCSERKCKCKDGWTSETCLMKTEISRAARCVGDGLRTTAFGDDCICSPFNNTCQCALGLKTGDICKKRSNDGGGNNNKSSSGNQPAWWKNRAIDLLGGFVLVVAAVVIFCMARRKQADDLKIALVEGPRSHDVSAF